MSWQVEYTDQFEEWWDTLSEGQQEELAATVELLMEYGPTLPYPYSSGITTSRHRHMRELRTQSGGEPLRTLYAFDPRRVSILLIGGTKTGNDRSTRNTFRSPIGSTTTISATCARRASSHERTP